VKSTNYESPKLQTLASTLRFAVTSASDAPPSGDKTRGPKSFSKPARWRITRPVWDTFTRNLYIPSAMGIVSLWRGPLCRHYIFNILPVLTSTHSSMPPQPFVGPWPLFQLRNPIRSPKDSLALSQGLYLTQTQNKCRHPFLEWDSNPLSHVLKRAKRFHAWDRAATVIGSGINRPVGNWDVRTRDFSSIKLATQCVTYTVL
jgi:hypothetical protein